VAKQFTQSEYMALRNMIDAFNAGKTVPTGSTIGSALPETAVLSRDEIAEIRKLIKWKGQLAALGVMAESYTLNAFTRNEISELRDMLRNNQLNKAVRAAATAADHAVQYASQIAKAYTLNAFTASFKGAGSTPPPYQRIWQLLGRAADVIAYQEALTGSNLHSKLIRDLRDRATTFKAMEDYCPKCFSRDRKTRNIIVEPNAFGINCTDPWHDS
jgi:hypothetical protein